jgi:predicted transcriptional regulator
LKFRTPGVAHVISAISDEISLRAFKQINENAKDFESLKEELELTSSQCRKRIRILMDAGLIERKKRYYGLTSFGRIIYEVLTMVSEAIENRSTLEMVDALRSTEIPKDEFAKFVNELIHDTELRQIITKQIFH